MHVKEPPAGQEEVVVATMAQKKSDGIKVLVAQTNADVQPHLLGWNHLSRGTIGEEGKEADTVANVSVASLPDNGAAQKPGDKDEDHDVESPEGTETQAVQTRQRGTAES